MLADLAPSEQTGSYMGQDYERDPEEEARRQEAQRRARMEALVQRLWGKLRERQRLRQTIEQRWLRALRQYNGEYEPEIVRALTQQVFGSRAFIPFTRRVCNLIEARLFDLLFPTEERNFAVDTSPVPELSEAQANADRLPPDTPVGPDGHQIPARALSVAIRELRAQAKSKAAGMERQIADRFAECNYPLRARQAIHQGIVFGSGVLKGPMVLGRAKKSWAEDGMGGWALNWGEDLAPTVQFVNIWDFFPDMTARTLEQSESEFERHRMTRAELARLAKSGGMGYDKDAIRRVLLQPPGVPYDTGDAMREASGLSGAQDKRYEVWEYHGSLDSEDLAACGCDMPDDPLMAYEAIVWFCNGEVLKATINPMDTEERPYSVWNWQQDESCIFGFGIADELDHLQTGANSIFRAAMDNSGLTVKPIIVLNSKMLRPVDGTWELTPGKIFDLGDDAGASVKDAFAFYQIDSKVAELLNVFGMIKSLIDEIGGPMLGMQGSDAPSLLKTDMGKSIAYTAANVWMRRGVRNFDDQVTSQLVGRHVNWEMQYNDDPSIKGGDLRPIARGTSALLEAEGQVQKMQALQQASAELPISIKHKVEQLRAMARALRLDPADLLPDDEEVAQLVEAEKKAAQAGPPMDPSQVRLQIAQLEMQDHQAQRQHEAEILAEKGRQLDRQIAAKMQVDQDNQTLKSQTEVFKTVSAGAQAEQDAATKAQMFNTEMVAKLRTGSGI